MSQIGRFTREESGFSGRIHTLTLYRDLTLVPVEPSESGNAPDYRLHQGNDEGPAIGVGWKRTGKRAGHFIALVIDDPALPHSIRANLYRDDDGGTSWSLHWIRPTKRRWTR